MGPALPDTRRRRHALGSSGPRPGVAVFLVWLVELALALPALGETTRVLVFSSADFPAAAGLADSLNIQLAGLATAELGPVVDGPSLGVKLAASSQHTRERGATLGIWVERGTRPG